MSLSQRIQDTESALLEKKDKLAAFHEGKGDINYTDDDMASIEKTNAEIARDEKLLAMLRDSERNMARAATTAGASFRPSQTAAFRYPRRVRSPCPRNRCHRLTCFAGPVP